MPKKKAVRKKTASKKSGGKKSATRKSAAKKSSARKVGAKQPGAKRVRTGRSTLTFLTESLPGFTVGQTKYTVIKGVGGTKPYSFGISGGTLPAGLSLNYKGRFGGTPTEAGSSTIFVKLIDFVGAHLTQAFDVQVMDA